MPLAGGDCLARVPRVRYPRIMCGRARLSSDFSEIKLVFSPAASADPEHRAELERRPDRPASGGPP